MSDFFENILGTSKNVKSLKEYEEIVRKSGMIWKKQFEYNSVVAGHVNFDDFFKVASGGNAKLCKFIIKCH